MQSKGETPRLILDAAVSQSTFYVHRVELGRSAYLRCTHDAEGGQPDIIQSIATILGLDAATTGKLYFDNLPLTDEQAKSIGARVGSQGVPSPEKRMTLRDWTMLHCGQLELKASSDMILPIPFATVLPGILLASEIIKERYFPEHVLRHRVNHDLFGQPLGWLTTPLLPKIDCPLCSDPTVLKAHKSRFQGR